MVLLLHSQFSSNRKKGSRVKWKKTKQLDMEKSQTQDSFLLLAYRLNILLTALERPLWMAFIVKTHWFHQNFKQECTQVYLSYRQGRKWVTHPSRSPFSISSLTITYFLSIGQEKSFALAHLTINFLTREIYFPGDGKGQCILRRLWKAELSEQSLCLPPSSL